MLSVCTEKELSIYHLEGKWNDYIGIQKEVISVLMQKGFFENKDVVNIETGMVVRVTTRGIKETFGNGNRFQTLPKEVKKQKIATIRMIPLLIREGKLLEDNVENYHESNGDKFAYFICPILIDGIAHHIRIVVRKKINTNHFYLHHIDTEKGSELLSPSKKTVNYEIQNL